MLNLMKNLIYLFSLICLISTNNSILAQSADNYQDRHPIYDYSDQQLSNTDTIPDYDSKLNKLKLTGVIYESDGITPAKDVILFIEQPNENGDFDLREKDEKRYVYHRSWVKTDADGRYTLYTFVPGNDRRYNRLQEILPSIKEPLKAEYNIETFLFDEDPLLSKRCRKKIAKKSDTSRILQLKKDNGILTAQRDIVLNSDAMLTQ